MEKRRNANFIFYIQAVLFFLLLVFLSAFFIDWQSLTEPIVNVCGFAFLFLNIPVSVIGRILKSRAYIDRRYYLPMKILAVINVAAAVIGWAVVVLILFVMVA